MKYILFAATALSAGVNARPQWQVPGLSNAINEINEILADSGIKPVNMDAPPPPNWGGGGGISPTPTPTSTGGSNGVKPTSTTIMDHFPTPHTTTTTIDNEFPDPTAGLDPIACYPDPPLDPLKLDVYTLQALYWHIRETFNSNPPKGYGNLTTAPWFNMTINLMHAIGRPAANKTSMNTMADVGSIETRWLLGHGKYGVVEVNSTAGMNGWLWPAYSAWVPDIPNMQANKVEDFLESAVSVDFVDALPRAQLAANTTAFYEIVLVQPFLTVGQCANSTHVQELLYWVDFVGNVSNYESGFVNAKEPYPVFLRCFDDQGNPN